MALPWHQSSSRWKNQTMIESSANFLSPSKNFFIDRISIIYIITEWSRSPSLHVANGRLKRVKRSNRILKRLGEKRSPQSKRKCQRFTQEKLELIISEMKEIYKDLRSSPTEWGFILFSQSDNGELWVSLKHINWLMQITGKTLWVFFILIMHVVAQVLTVLQIEKKDL